MRSRGAHSEPVEQLTDAVVGVLADPEAPATRLATTQNAGPDTVRDAVTLPERGVDVPQLIPFSLQAKKALELTFGEELRLGHNYIGTEHQLLALLELETGDRPCTVPASTRPTPRPTSPACCRRSPPRRQTEASHIPPGAGVYMM